MSSPLEVVERPEIDEVVAHVRPERVRRVHGIEEVDWREILPGHRRVDEQHGDSRSARSNASR